MHYLEDVYDLPEQDFSQKSTTARKTQVDLMAILANMLSRVQDQERGFVHSLVYQ
jgi:hypothetical protein